MPSAEFSITICLFGVVSNTCLTILLTRPRMQTTINRLLALVTFSDAILMLSYLIYVLHFELGAERGRCPVSLLTYGWVSFQLIHSNMSVYLRAFSLWLSVTMAGYRKTILSRTVPLKQEKLNLALKLATTVAACVLISCSPIFVQNTVARGPPPPPNDTVCPRNVSEYYVLKHPRFVVEWRDGVLLKTAFWTNGLLLKLLPCAVLSYYLVHVVVLMYRRHLRRERSLFQNRPSPQNGNTNNNSITIVVVAQQNRDQQKKISTTSSSSSSNNNNQKAVMMPTSIILVTILLTTVVCELPNAVLSLMTGSWPHVFARSTYVRLGEVMDFLSLFSCTSTSILYFIMSRALRKSLITSIRRVRKALTKLSSQPLSQASLGNGGGGGGSARTRASDDDEEEADMECTPLKSNTPLTLSHL